MIYKKIPGTCNDNWRHEHGVRIPLNRAPNCLFFNSHPRKFCSLYRRDVFDAKPPWCKASVIAVAEEDVDPKTQETIREIVDITEAQ